MNVIFLSPHFPLNFYHFCRHLKHMGGNVLGIGDVAYDSLTAGQRSSLTEYYRVDNMEEYEQVVRACDYFTHRYGKLDRAESHNEHWLHMEARLRTDFDMTGIQASDMAEFQKKSQMKQRFVAAGIPVARGRVVQSRQELEAWIAEIGYPVVAKPDRGVGASNTYRLNNVQDREEFLATNPVVAYMVEEFIDGSICSFDGLTDHDGNIVFYTAHQNCDGIMEIVNNDLHTAYYSLRKIPADLEAAGRKAVQCFPLSDRFFHIEFFRTRRDGKLIALEANLRPPGGLTMDMFNYANDIDMYAQWASVVLHKRFTANYDRPYHCAFIGRKFSKPYVFTHDEIVANYGGEIVHHTAMSPVFRRAMGDYAYLVRSGALDKIFEIKEFIHRIR